MITDGDTFAAPAAFSTGSWTVVPRRFLPRRLHAYKRTVDLLADNLYAERAAPRAAVELGDLEVVIRPYAERADWAGFIVFAETELEKVDAAMIHSPG